MVPGKTTLLKAMMGLIKVESGNIYYDSTEIRFNQQYQFAQVHRLPGAEQPEATGP